MATRKLDKKEWRTFFDGVSKALGAKQVEIEVMSLNIGDQLQTDWVQLFGLTYDPKDDLFEVALEGLDHLIPKPQEIYVEDGDTGLTTVTIVDAEGERQIVKLRDPIALSAS